MHRSRSLRALLVVPALAGLSVIWVVGVTFPAPRPEVSAVEAGTSAPLAGDTRRPWAGDRGRVGGGTSQVGSAHRAPGMEAPAPPLGTAGRFFLTELRRKVSGDWAGSWRHLHPFHRRIAPLDAFVRCETATPFPAALESVRVVRVRTESFRIPGLRRALQSAAVTVAVELEWYGPRDPVSFERTFHLVPVDGRWTWLLSDERFRLYARDLCLPDGARR